MNWKRPLVLALALGLALLTALPAANPPVLVYENALAVSQLAALPAVACAWGYLALSRRRRVDFLAAFGLNLLVVLCLCRDLGALEACYAYYVPG